MAESGWYADGDDPTVERYWDGANWTEQTRPAISHGQFATTPLPPTPPGATAGYAAPLPTDRPWYKKKRYFIPAAVLGFFIVVGIISSATGSGSSNKKNTSDAAPLASTSPASSAAESTTSATTPSQVVTVTAPPATRTVTATPPKAATSPAAALRSWTMPNEVGKVLQDAQDDIQRVSADPVFFSHSQDATGADRFQVLDYDWKVCSQNIKPGKRVAWDGHVVFYVVKLDESCP